MLKQDMSQSIITVVLAVAMALSCSLLLDRLVSARLPDNQLGYQPVQPIEYSHRLHAGELQIQCAFCHTDAAVSRHASIPTADTCMKCHDKVTAGWNEVQAERKLATQEDRPAKRVVSPELLKLYDALGLDQDLKPDPAKTPKPIEWVRIHKLPDHVYFNHSAHVAADVSCQQCHGPVETMEQVRQQETLSMGWCVNCHRDAAANGINGKPVKPSNNCATCHY